jgi:large subunit ribosomal protein L6
MSRIAKKVIVIPEKAEITVEGKVVRTKGPLGELTFVLNAEIEPTKTVEGITLKPLSQNIETLALWGTYAAIIRNNLKGVTEGFTKKLVVDGIGYKADVKANGNQSEIVMALGFSHPVKVTIPEGIKVTNEKNTLIITGIDREKVGGFAAGVRALKKPEPYKGKGIRYDTEVIRRKQGKKSV